MTWRPETAAPQARIAARSGFTPTMFHHAGEIVGKHVQRHLGGDLRQPLHQEVRRAHPHLERAEGVSTVSRRLAHGLRILVETPLRRLQYMLVLQRVIRRSLPVVQWCLIAQVPQAFGSSSGRSFCPFLLVHVVERCRSPAGQR